MTVTFWTVLIAAAGALIMTVLATLQTIAVLRPKSKWVVRRVYGGHPNATDPVAYFAYNLGLARADVFLWAPLQFAGSAGMLLGERWGFLLALMASVPYWYSAIPILTWDRRLGYADANLWYWLKWAVFPVYGLAASAYCFARLIV